jgi:hypothetical protein
MDTLTVCLRIKEDGLNIGEDLLDERGDDPV